MSRTRKTRWLLPVLTAIACGGCSTYDWLFAVMQPFYTDEGGTEFDQKRHFDDRVAAWEEQEASG